MDQIKQTTSASTLDDLIERTPDLPWLEHAACATLEFEQLDLFFVEAGRSISQATLALCRRCPVRRDCLEHAYRHEIISGYFGGMSPARRRTLDVDQALAELEHSA